MIVLVTGASAGFGAAITRRFAKDGHQIVAVGRRDERLNDLRKELGRDLVHPHTLDVRDRASVADAIASLPRAFSDVDVLVNNAGLALALEPAQRASLDDWDAMVDTNAKGLMYATHAVLPGMVERDRGHVINLGSVAAIYPYPGGKFTALLRPSSVSSHLTCSATIWMRTLRQSGWKSAPQFDEDRRDVWRMQEGFGFDCLGSVNQDLRL